MSTPRERRLEQARREISLTFRTRELLANLMPYFNGLVDIDDLTSVTIEQLVAIVMGWNYRAIQIKQMPTNLLQLVSDEVDKRVARMDPITPPDIAERAARRMNKGGVMRDGNVIVKDDLDVDTVFRMWKRIERVHRLVNHVSGRNDEDQAVRLLGRIKFASDELLLDTFIYLTLVTPDSKGRVRALGAEPTNALEFLEEMSRDLRRQADWTDEFGEPVDQHVINELSTHYPGEYEAHKKVAHLTRAYIPPRNDAIARYRRLNNLSVFDDFWTEERIRVFIALEARTRNPDVKDYLDESDSNDQN